MAPDLGTYFCVSCFATYCSYSMVVWICYGHARSIEQIDMYIRREREREIIQIHYHSLVEIYKTRLPFGQIGHWTRLTLPVHTKQKQLLENSWRSMMKNEIHICFIFHLDSSRLALANFLENAISYVKMFILSLFPQEYELYQTTERRVLFDLLFKYMYIFLLFV
jgi:hypothetical protein